MQYRNTGGKDVMQDLKVSSKSLAGGLEQVIWLHFLQEEDQEVRAPRTTDRRQKSEGGSKLQYHNHPG